MTHHLLKTVGVDVPPSSLHNQYTAWCPLSTFTGLPIKIVQDSAGGVKKTSWELFLCTKHGQNRDASLMVCGVKCQMTGASLEKTKAAEWPHFNVMCKTLRSCRTYSGMNLKQEHVWTEIVPVEGQKFIHREKVRKCHC